MLGSPRRTSGVFALIFVLIALLVFLAEDASQGGDLFRNFVGMKFPGTSGLSGGKRGGENYFYSNISADDVESMKKKLTPRRLLTDGHGSLIPHQFLHLHNMKTGGTSLDSLINCGMNRLKKTVHVNYTQIHECSEGYYSKCVSGESEQCLSSVREAAVMSYCAPLKDLATPFQWMNDPQSSSIHAAVTVLRHPVARVWSMFRFQTKNCYDCRNLKDIYAELDKGGDAGLRDTCRLQLLNHQARNLLLQSPENGIPDTDDYAEEAIHNLKTVFSMVGVTEDMPNTAEIAGRVFPWLAKDVDWKNVFDVDTLSGDTSTCSLPHSNASPQNNRCRNGKHWRLPDYPDKETAAAILAHNQVDLKLYEAGLKQFKLQKLALGLA